MPGQTPDQVWDTSFVSREEFEQDKVHREAQRAADLARDCEQAEKLNKVVSNTEQILEYINRKKGQEEEEAKHADENKEKQRRIDQAVRWVEMVRGASGWIAAVGLALLTGIWFLADNLLIQPVFELLKKIKGA